MLLLDFEKCRPAESIDGCFKFEDVPSAMQFIVDCAHAAGHPLISPPDSAQRQFIDIGFAFDKAKDGFTVLQAIVCRSKDSLGAQDVKNCNAIGVGEVDDTGESMAENFAETLQFINAGMLFCIIFILYGPFLKCLILQLIPPR